MSYLPADLHDRLLEADNRHCAYCRMTEANTGQPMTVYARRRWVSVGWHPPD